jgi:hypothetical protein
VLGHHRARHTRRRAPCRHPRRFRRGACELKTAHQVAALSTGDELVRAGRPRHRHQIYDSNDPMLLALFASPALELRLLDCCPDDPARLRSQIKRAARGFDLLICSGGVSGSDSDHVMASVHGVGGSCTKLSLTLKPQTTGHRSHRLDCGAGPARQSCGGSGGSASVRATDARKARRTIRARACNHDGKGRRDPHARSRPD